MVMFERYHFVAVVLASTCWLALANCPYLDLNEQDFVPRTYDKYHYVHLSKTSGTYTSILLYALNAAYPGSFYFQKDSKLDFQLSKSNFNVGSIRRLDDWYFSYWGYAPSLACQLMPKNKTLANAVARCEHAASHHLFLQWMESLAPSNVGFASFLFFTRYKRNSACDFFDPNCVNSEIKSFLRSSQESIWIDRWVRAENLYSDLIRSIAVYSKGRKAGPLNMTKVELIIAQQTEKALEGRYPPMKLRNMEDKHPTRDKEEFVKDIYFSQLSPAVELLSRIDSAMKDHTMC